MSRVRADVTRLVGGFAFCAVTALVAPARAQTEAELSAARELFQDAFKDEQEERYEEALEKFQRVARVRESSSVRYRIATVLAAKKRLREARDIYRALAATRPTAPTDREIADSAAVRAAELDRRIPKLVLRVQGDPPPGIRVAIDGAPVPTSADVRVIELDPGEHVVSVTAPGFVPLEQSMSLAEGAGEQPLTMALVREDRRASTVGGSENVLAWGLLGGGTALFAVGAVLLASRESAISDIRAACPGNVCPANRRAEIENDRDRAELLGPLGGTFSIAGLVAAGVGIFLLFRSPEAVRSAVVHPTPAGLGLTSTF